MYRRTLLSVYIFLACFCLVSLGFFMAVVVGGWGVIFFILFCFLFFGFFGWGWGEGVVRKSLLIQKHTLTQFLAVCPINGLHVCNRQLCFVASLYNKVSLLHDIRKNSLLRGIGIMKVLMFSAIIS